MTFDAGSIDAKVTADRSAFSRTLREARAEADAFSRNPVRIRIELDAAALRQAQLRLATLTHARVAPVRVDLDTRAAELRIAELERRLARLGNGGGPNGPTPNRPNGGGNNRGPTAAEAKNMNLMLTAALALGPALIPIAGAAAAAGGALGAMGIAGVLAFKGIGDEIKNNTALGKQYNALLGQSKSALGTLEHSAASNFYGGFSSIVGKLNTELPRFNGLIGTSATNLGSIASHLVGGIVSGFNTFGPLILKVEGEIDRLAGRFETWASGPGGARFAQTLGEDFDKVIPILGHLFTAVGRIIAGFGPAGGIILDEIDGISKAINALPLPALQAFLTMVVALKTAALVTAPLGMLSRNLIAAGAGSGRLATGLGAVGMGLSRLTPYVAVAVGLHFAFKAAANATDDWATSTNDVQYAAHETFKALKQLTSLDFSGFWDTLTSSSDDTARSFAINFRDALKDAQILTVNGRKDSNDYSTAWLQNGKLVFGTLDTLTGKFADLTHQQQQQIEQTRTYRSEAAKLDAQIGSFRGSTRGTSVTNLVPMYNQEATALDQLNQKNLKQITTGKSVAETYRGVKISQEAVLAVMSKYGMNVDVALGFLQGQVDAELKGAAAAKEFADKAKTLNTVVSGAESIFGLTAQQVDLYSQAMGISGYQVANGSIVQQQFNMAMDQAKTAIDNGGVAINDWVAAIAQFNSGADTATSRAALMGQAMVSLQGDALGYANTMVKAASANQQLITDFNATKSGVINLKTGFIDYHNAGAAPVLNDLQQLQTAAMNAAAATYQHEVSTLGLKQASKDAADVFRNDTYGALVSQHKQLGITRQEAEKLATRYFHWPKNAKTLIEQLGGDKVQHTLADILLQLEYLNGLKAKPTVDVNTYDATSKLSALQQYINNMHGRTIPISIASGAVGGTKVPIASGSRAAFGRADGKVPPNTVATVGEGASHTWEGLVTDAQGRATIYSNRQAKAMGWSAPVGYANGSGPEHGGFSGQGGAGAGPGSTGGPSTGSGSGSGSSTAAKTDMKWRRYKGYWYQGLLAYNEAVAADRAHGNTIRSYGSGKYKGYGFQDQTFDNYHAAQNARTDYTRGLTTQRKAIVGDANSEAKLWDTKGELSRGAKQAASTIQTSVNKIEATLKAAATAKSVPWSMVRQFEADNKKLQTALANRDKWAQTVKDRKAKYASDLQERNQYSNSIRDVYTGQFDIGTSGNGYKYGIAASLHQAVVDTKKEKSLIDQAKKLHLDPRLIAQLEAEGPQGAANLQAIVSGGASYVAGINKDYAALNGAANAIAKESADDKYKKKLAADTKAIADAQAQVAKYTEDAKDQLHNIHGIVKSMDRTLKSELDRKRKNK